MEIRNNTRQGMDFVVRGPARNGIAPTEHIGPGETRDIDVDPASAELRGRAAVRAVTIVSGGTDPAAPAPAPAAKPARQRPAFKALADRD